MVRVAFALMASAMLVSCGAGSDNSKGSAAAGSDTAHFVNSPVNAQSMALRDAYVDFSFDYPSRWSQTPQPIDGTAQNYVRVAAPMVNGYEPYAFLVGHVSGTGDAARDSASIPVAARALAAQFGASLQNYRIVSSGPGRVAGYDSYGWRFTATAPGVGGEPPVQIYGRGDLILPPGANRGVTLVAIATSRAGDVHEAAEVGQSGPLKAILDSFRLAANAAPAPAAAPAGPPPENELINRPANATNAAPSAARPPAPRPAPPTPPAAAPAQPQVRPPAPSTPPAAPEPPRPVQLAPPPPARDPPAGNGQ